ncbi:MAG: CDP-glucose 4,6-dehydratase [Deltaproteobacteria bacterium]|nr:CDP-glucose 4,6-dehydratase [Deltaproteobacteria bacterium]
MNAVFWKNKKVLVTGHTGFKGSWLSLWLQMMGANVTGVSLPPPTSPNHFEAADVAKGMASVLADVRDHEKLQAIMAGHRPEIIIHMAAQPLVRYSYQNPRETYATNVMGTVNVLEAVRQLGGVRSVLVVTSDKCYENKDRLRGYREGEPLGGHDPYSSSKGCAELVTAAYRNSYFNINDYGRHGVGVASVRAGNVIGGGDWAEDRLVPDIMKALMENRHVTIRNPGAVRPWQHVLEPLGGYLSLAERLWGSGPAYSGAWNFGPDDENARPVSWIIETMISLWGGSSRWTLDQGRNPYEAKYLRLDCTKVKTALGWSPKLGIFETLERVIRWYRDYQQGMDMRAVAEAEIASYENLHDTGGVKLEHHEM